MSAPVPHAEAIGDALGSLAWIETQANSAQRILAQADITVDEMSMLASITSDIEVNASMAFDKLEQSQPPSGVRYRFKQFGVWLAASFLPVALAAGFGFHFGSDVGHERGRIEMKCAIFAVVERLGDDEPAPGRITLGCDKALRKAAK